MMWMLGVSDARKTQGVGGIAGAARATEHDGTAKAFAYCGLYDVFEMRSEFNR